MNSSEGTRLVKLSENDIGDNRKINDPDKLTANENVVAMSDEIMTSILWDKDQRHPKSVFARL